MSVTIYMSDATRKKPEYVPEGGKIAAMLFDHKAPDFVMSKAGERGREMRGGASHTEEVAGKSVIAITGGWQDERSHIDEAADILGAKREKIEGRLAKGQTFHSKVYREKRVDFGKVVNVTESYTDARG